MIRQPCSLLALKGPMIWCSSIDYRLLKAGRFASSHIASPVLTNRIGLAKICFKANFQLNIVNKINWLYL